MQVSSWKSASYSGLRWTCCFPGDVRGSWGRFSPAQPHSALNWGRGSTPGTGWSGMMGACHQETLQVLLVAGPDHQQAHYLTRILGHKQRSSHTALSYLSPGDRSAPGRWHHQCPRHGGSHSPHTGTLPAHPRVSPSLPRPCAGAPADALSSPVQFSKEKYILDSSPEKLHKELEEELKLSSTDLRSHAWYHGRIPREVSRGRWVALGTFCLGCSGESTPRPHRTTSLSSWEASGRGLH